jgi:hypothetical protein
MKIRMEGQVQLGGFGAWCGKRYQGCPEGLGMFNCPQNSLNELVKRVENGFKLYKYINN